MQTIPAHRTPPLAGDRISVLFCCDPGYYQHLAVALVSLCENNRASFLDIHLISSRRDAAAEGRLIRSIARYANQHFTVHSFSLADCCGNWFVSNHIRSETYIRIFAAGLLPSLDKVLYLDADLVVTGDLRPLWDTDIADHALAAVPDPYGTFRRAPLGIPADQPYVNAGVLLLNLERWRAEGLAERLAGMIETAGDRLTFHDQDAINAVLYRSIKTLGYRWNFQARMQRGSRETPPDQAPAIADARRSPAIIHYTSERKPWLFIMATPHKRLYWRYLALTDWRGAAPQGRSWANAPEFAFNHAAYWAHSNYTLQRFLVSTNAGRVIVHSGRLLKAMTHPLRSLSDLLGHPRSNAAPRTK